MRRFLFNVVVGMSLAGCSLLGDLEGGNTRLKPHDPGAAQTYRPTVSEAPDPATEAARPSPGSVAPLPRHRPHRVSARTPRPQVAAPPSDGVSAPLPAPVEDATVAAPPPEGKEHAADAPKPVKGVKMKKCRAPGGWAVWRRKCPPPPTDG